MEINHWVILQQNQSVCPNTKVPVTHPGNPFSVIYGKISLTVIKQDKIVPGSLVFVKFDLHVFKDAQR